MRYVVIDEWAEFTPEMAEACVEKARTMNVMFIPSWVLTDEEDTVLEQCSLDTEME